MLSSFTNNCNEIFLKPIHQFVGSTLSKVVFEIETSETFLVDSTLLHAIRNKIVNEKKMFL